MIQRGKKVLNANMADNVVASEENKTRSSFFEDVNPEVKQKILKSMNSSHN